MLKISKISSKFKKRKTLEVDGCLQKGHPSLGKGGQKGSSKHNFAATPLFLDLSTPLDSFFSSSDKALGLRIKGAVGGRKCRRNRISGLNRAHHFPHTAPNSDIDMSPKV